MTTHEIAKKLCALVNTAKYDNGTGTAFAVVHQAVSEGSLDESSEASDVLLFVRDCMADAEADAKEE